jgi:hypothetical protein
MAETKYGKYILTEPKPELLVETDRIENVDGEPEQKDEVLPGFRKRMVFLDSTVIPGALFTDCLWFLRKPDKFFKPAHTHDYDEVLGFMGSDPENPHDLGGELEFWLDDERHILTKSCMIFVPRGLKHCPMSFLRLDRPIFHFCTCNTNSYAYGR